MHTFTCALPPELQPCRSTTADVVLLLALLSKLATEPLALGAAEDLPKPDGSGPAATGTSSSPQVGFRRITAALLKDTALRLLADVFAVAGRGFAASPLLAACVARMVTPALLSHVMSPRIALPCLSICIQPLPGEAAAAAGATGGDGADGGAGGAAAAASSNGAAAASAAGPVPPALAPISLLRTVLQVIAAMWASRGCDDSGDGPGSAAGIGAMAALSGGSPVYGSHGGAPAAIAVGSTGPATSVREACAREIGVLLRCVLLHTLASRAAPAAMRVDALEAFSEMVVAPQALMELYLNHDLVRGLFL